MKEFTLEEIEDALKDTESSKAPGPDGLNAGVLKSLWSTIKLDVLRFFSNLYHSGVIPKGCNSSFIVLIPKSDSAKHASNFRPISLMNAIMKLLTKVLARILKGVMDILVSDSQMAFIKGMQLSDCVLITSEVYAALKSRKIKGVIMKIDFEKAFDSVRWDFILQVLACMNFDQKWISWIKSILDSARISILDNGSATSEFSPKRGLLQGDPLSPLLFNLIGEVLPHLLQSANKNGIFSGIRLPNCSEEITHLHFADDVILFLHNDFSSITGIKRVLQCFYLISGLKINFHKSSLFGFEEDPSIISNWAGLLECMVGVAPFKYLGATIAASPRNIKFLDPLILKFKNKLESWDFDHLSIAGKLVLLKACLDSIPVFWFSLFFIPQTVILTLEKLRRKFLWGTNSNGASKFHLLKWDKVCQGKKEGGLGIVPLRARNLALLAKWWWRSYRERNKMWNKILMERYGRAIHYNLHVVPEDPSISYSVLNFLKLKRIENVAQFLNQQCFKWILGNGESIYFWEDYWTEGGPLMFKLPRMYRISKLKHSSVHCFLENWERFGGGDLIWSRRLHSRDHDDVLMLSTIVNSISLSRREDSLKYWLPSKGVFSTKNCTLLLTYQAQHSQSTSLNSGVWSKIWSVKVPPKITIFLWKLQWSILPTRQFLNSRLPNLSLMCAWCDKEIESSNHLFWKCELAKWAWDHMGKWWSVTRFLTNITNFSLKILLDLLKARGISKVWEMVVAATIWLARNEVIFSGNRMEKSSLVHLINFRVCKWGKASKLIDFGNDPLWLVNPHGAWALYNHSVSKN